MKLDATEGTKQQSERPSARSLHIMLIAQGIAWGLYLSLLTFAVPRVETIFVDFGLPLPRSSVLVLWLSRRAVVFAPIALLFLAANTLFLSKKLAVRLPQGWRFATLGLPLLLIALTLTGLLLPLLYTDMGVLSG